MNSLQNKAVSALQILVSKYLLLLFVMLLGVDNAKAQQSSQNRIIGYWKWSTPNMVIGDTDMKLIFYNAILANGSGKEVLITITNDKKTAKTSTYKYWFEGKYYYTQNTGRSEVLKSTLDWVSDNEVYQTWENGDLEGTTAHQARITKEEFEKHYNNHEPPTVPGGSSQSGGKNPFFNCYSCFGTCEERCHRCDGTGKMRRQVSESEWDASEKRYKTVYKDASYDCEDCHYGKIKCTEPLCPCNKR